MTHRPAALVAALALAVCGQACAALDVPNVFGSGPDPRPVHVPRRAEVSWHGFDVRLDPTVRLWAKESGVDLETIVVSALERIEGALHGKPVTIAVSAGSIYAIRDVGIRGLTDAMTGEVSITMDQRSPVPPRRLLATWLPLVLAHELHHSKRIVDGPGYGRNLLSVLVSEGSAEAFVRETYPHAPDTPWARPLSPAVSRLMWQRARRDLTSPDDGPRHDAWFVGGSSGFPRWAGYRLGLAVARAYLHSHPRITAAALAMLPAGEIFLYSGYRP